MTINRGNKKHSQKKKGTWQTKEESSQLSIDRE